VAAPRGSVPVSPQVLRGHQQIPGNAAIWVESVSRGEDAAPCLLHEVICRVAVSGQAPATLKQLRPVTMDQPIEGHHIHGVRADRFDQHSVERVFALGIAHWPASRGAHEGE